MTQTTRPTIEQKVENIEIDGILYLAHASQYVKGGKQIVFIDLNREHYAKRPLQDLLAVPSEIPDELRGQVEKLFPQNRFEHYYQGFSARRVA